MINRDTYDTRRPEGAPSSKTLVRTYGSWHAVCSRAYGLNPDGTYDRKARTWPLSQPWPNPHRGKRIPESYTLDEVLAGIRLCASSTGHRPSSQIYERSSARHGRTRTHPTRRRI